MAISTYPIALYYDSTPLATATWSSLSPIKDFPDLGGSPELLDTTTLSDASKTYVAGIKDQQALEFTANYDETVYDLIATLTTEQDFQLWFGTTGASGKFAFTGTVIAYVLGAGVNGVVEMKIVVTPSTAVSVV